MLMRSRVQQVRSELEQARTRLGQMMNSTTDWSIGSIPLKQTVPVLPDESTIAKHPVVRSATEQESAADARWRMERSSMLPEFNLGAASMTLYQSPSVPDGSVIYGRDQRFTMVRAGVGIPLFFGAQHARNKAARIDTERASNETLALTQEVRAQLMQAQQRYTAQLARVEAFEQGAQQEAEQLRRSAEEAYLNGQIDRLEWTLLTGQSITLSMEYLDALRDLGRAAFELNAFNEQ